MVGRMKGVVLKVFLFVLKHFRISFGLAGVL